MNYVMLKSFSNEMEKIALMGEALAFGAKDIAHTPRLFMSKRAPQELLNISKNVNRAIDKYYVDPVHKPIAAGIRLLPQSVQQPAYAISRGIVNDLPAAAIPIPGAMPVYSGLKGRLESWLTKQLHTSV